MGRDLASSDAFASGQQPVVTSPVVVTLFGAVTVRLGGHHVRVASRKAQAVLAFMALTDGAAVSRERLCGLLWSESSEDKARASLRQTLHGLRTALAQAGRGFVDAGREVIGLSGEWSSDATEILNNLAVGHVDPALLNRKRLADALLPDFDDLDPSFRIWLLIQRQSMQERLARALEALLGRGGAVGRDAAAALLNLDPTHEEACRHVMADAAARGDVAAALATYRRLWQLLDEEYGAEPSERTQALVIRIKLGDPRPSEAPSVGSHGPAPAKAKTDDHPYLIVAPFEGDGEDERLLGLAAGLRHELVAKLVRFREWSVLDGAGPAIDVGALPGRPFSIGAAMRRAGPNLALTLTIKTLPAGRYVWSESFAVAAERWVDIEPHVLRRIAVAVNIHLTAERLAQAASATDVSLGVYERWLRGQSVMMSFDAGDWLRARAIFESITAEAPRFSPAYSALAQLNNGRHLAFPGAPRTAERAVEAVSLAVKALEIDPFDSRAHLAHGWALALNRQWDRAELSFELALKLNENDPWTLISSALAMAFCGRRDLALELAGQSLSLVPQPPPVHWGYQATLRFVCADYAGSASAAERAGQAFPNLPAWHAAALVRLGSHAVARERAEAFLHSMRPRWKGEDSSDEAIVSWFQRSFPIRLPTDRATLHDALLRALS